MGAQRAPRSNRECEEPVDESAADVAQAIMVQGRELCAEVLARQFRAARNRRKDDSGLAARIVARIVVCQRVGPCALLTGLQEVDYFAHGVSAIIWGCRFLPPHA